MKKIELNIDEEIKEFNLPEKWEEVSVGKAQKLYAVTETNPILKIIGIVSILTDIDVDTLMLMDQSEFMRLSEQIQFTSTEVKGELKDSVMVDEVEYFLKKDFETLTLGEVISIDTIMEQCDNDLSKAMTKLLCVFLKRKKENGKLEAFHNDHMDREKEFSNIPITDINDIFFFFSGGENL